MPKKPKNAEIGEAPQGSHRTYTDEEINHALLNLAIYNRNFYTAARVSHVPEATLRGWVEGYTANGKYYGPKHKEKFENLCEIKKEEQNRQISCLLQVAFQGIMDNLKQGKLRDFITIWGITMDKLIAQGLVGSDAANALDKILPYAKFINKDTIKLAKTAAAFKRK